MQPQCTTAVPKKAVPTNHLPLYGITFSRVHIDRLVKAGKFPAPFKLSANRNAWWESDILAFLEERSATRGESDETRRAAAHRAAVASVAAHAAR